MLEVEPTAGLCLLTSERGTSIYRSHFKAQSQLVCEASRKFYLLMPGSQGHWGRVPEVEEGSAGQCLALRGESSQVLKRDCRDNIFGKLEARWRAKSPSATRGSPGTWSRHSPRLCSTALGKVSQYADLEPEGGAGLLIKLGTQVATACVGCCLSTSPLVRYGANHGGRRGHGRKLRNPS